MASIQETLRAALGADETLTALVEDRIFPGEIPDDEADPPWLFYQVPESVPYEELDDGDTEVQHQVEFHALGDSYSTAKTIIECVKAVLNSYHGGQIRRAFWQGTSEDQTEEGYHHVARFTVWGTSQTLTTVIDGGTPSTTFFSVTDGGAP